MARIGDFVALIDPVALSTPCADVLHRFQTEPNTLAIAVVDPEHRPVGLIERNAFTLRMAAEFGRALYARRPASVLMDPAPHIADARSSAEVFFKTFDQAELGALLGGFVVVEDGRYLGVGSALHIVQAGSALYRQRAEEMGALVRKLAGAEAEAKASSRAKSEFLAVMSHEIRTPLNGVLGVAGLLERKLEQEELRPYVRTILGSGESLLRLLTDALDMSRAQAGMLSLDEEPVDLAAVASDLEALWRARADEKGLNLTFVTEVAGHDWVMADGIRLKQMLNNLIGNALKFTEAGEVAVTIRSAWADGRVQVEFVVEDTGPGIPPDTAATIFQPFNTGSAGRASAGAGMGLAICRQIADVMGGDIALEPGDRGGARFIVRLPLACAGPETRKQAEARAEPTPHEHVHVLVVDDNATNRFVAAKLLELFGCTFETVENGREAVEAASQSAFDIILMDIKMPVMDGVEATRAIRALPGAAGSVPILALTANADERDEVGYLAVGMNGVAQKPIQADALLDAMRRALTPVEAIAEAA